ncbi:MAG TPA: hypothetical protein VK687_11915 [Bryobacteraceae bacterium]|nr:hypothetical protein [Bryobacteraceae bacterium]
MLTWRTSMLLMAAGLTALAQTGPQKQNPKGAGAANRWTPPRTPWGDPDLQGIWNNSTITELERPQELSGKQVLADDEAAALEQKAAQNRVDRAPKEGDPGTYNQFWMDRGTKVVPTKRTSLIVDPPDGRLPPLTAAGQKRQEERFKRLGPSATGSSGNGPFDSYEDVSVVTRCITRGLPNAMFPGGYNNNYRILQVPGSVVLLTELMHEIRVIPLDGRPHMSENIRQWMGDSRGHWEGNTLVVDVTNFPDRDVTGFGVAYRYGETSNLHLIERFTRIDADTIDYQVTVDDPTTFTKPWTASIPMVKSDAPPYEYACHEGNYSMVNILKASREQDKSTAGAAKNGPR